MSSSSVDSPLESAGEVPFHLHEIFFSRTDHRGVIQSGNDIFERVSGFSMDELLGAPHKMVRHPDMPRAVFWLLWEQIKAGNPIGSFVKNRTKDGRYYWVFAIVTPLIDGFVSVRFKPTSPLLNKVAAIYAEVRAVENTTDKSPEETAQILIDKLKDMGFADYQAFMAYAIAEEVLARNAGLGREEDRILDEYIGMRTGLENVMKNAHDIADGFKNIQTLPTNMRLKSARMGDVAAPLTAILVNFDVLTGTVRSSMETFLSCSHSVLATVHGGLFVTCAGMIQQETISRFEPANVHEEIEAVMAEAHRLSDLNIEYAEKVSAAMQSIRFEITQFFDMAVQLKRTLSGLGVTRILCQIESARLDDPSGGMSEVIAQLRHFQELSYECLLQIEHESNKLKGSVEAILLNAKQQPDVPLAFEFPRPPIKIERRAQVRPEGT